MTPLKSYIVSKGYLILALVAVMSVIVIGFAVIKSDRERYTASVRHNVEMALDRATDQIRYQFFESVLISNKIESLLENSREIPEAQIARVVDELIQHNPSVVTVALAPNLEVTHSFPQNANQGTVGLKYFEVPAQMSSVARAYRWRSPVVVGPVQLVQGGEGFILRYPVQIRRDDADTPRFWGIISIVVKSDQLFGAYGSDNMDYEFGLRELHSSSRPYRSMFGDPDLFEGDPVIREITMLGSTWQATAKPKEGWPAYSPQSPVIMLLTLISAVLLLAILMVLRRLSTRIEKANALLAETIECIDEGFIAFDEKDRLVTVNERYLSYYPKIADAAVPGVTFEELIRIDAARNNYPEAIGREEEWIQDRLAAHYNPGAPFFQKSDQDRWFKVVEAKSPRGYTVGIRTDVTAVKRAQELAERADREKTEFLNNVSHELRTPLTVISGRVAFLQNPNLLAQAKTLQAALSADELSREDVISAVAEYQDQVSKQGASALSAAQHMLRLVEDLLDWTKVESGRLELDLAPVEVGTIASSIVSDLRPAAEAKGLRLSYFSDCDATIMADQTRLKQILYNLTSNAIKFTQTGGISLVVTHDDDEIVFTVKDTGCGIRQEDFSRIFKRFQQVDGSMTRQMNGLGLGLAIADQLAKLHGGALSLTSTVGEGSAFRLVLPKPAVSAHWPSYARLKAV
ncbi:ATP-binding protein [Roseovarius nanhaiticus]|uniref:ATP-binding protein n=1 Tax=Roseovarius nanhaiticus TaxID=573024 RepID=UPI002490E101|nr:ATP-binding protein [Roseovarius nanhaiticus]